jgi:hypothetical protein
MLDQVEYNPLQTKNADGVSAERIKELTMKKITHDVTSQYEQEEYATPARRKPRVRRSFAAAAVAVVLVVSLSATAMATNAFGIGDFLSGIFTGWKVDPAAGTLELDTEGKGEMGTYDADGNVCRLSIKSLTLSERELKFSYTVAYSGDGADGGVLLPAELNVKMKDGSTIAATITDYSAEDVTIHVTDTDLTVLEGKLVTGTATFAEPVNLVDASYLIFGSPDIGSESFGTSIPINWDNIEIFDDITTRVLSMPDGDGIRVTVDGDLITITDD